MYCADVTAGLARWKWESLKMTTFEYLIRDGATGDKAWVAAGSLREALIKRENELRAAAADQWRRGKPLLPAKAKVSQYSQGGLIDVSIADVSCVGHLQDVIRQV